VSDHVLFVAKDMELSTSHWAKNNLGDTELALIFQEIMQQSTGVANSKQHYAAMLLAWTTSARPGSFTVGRGYAKGDPTGIPGKTIPEDETLRWEDVEWIRTEEGIAAKLTMKYTKGYRNPHANCTLRDASRSFTFLPTRGCRFEFDLALILFGLAFTRGLFVGGLEDILNSDTLYIRTRPEIAAQAILVSSNQSGSINPDKPMLESALNEKLQILCRQIGLYRRNTYYSFRRTAIIETRRRSADNMAKNLAFHVHNAHSILAYDNEGLSSTDITAFRLGEDHGRTAEEIAGMWRQSRVARLCSPETNLPTLLKQRLQAKLPEDEEYIRAERKLADAYDNIYETLISLQEAGTIACNKLTRGYAAHQAHMFQALLQEYQATQGVHKLFDELSNVLSIGRSTYRHQPPRQFMRTSSTRLTTAPSTANTSKMAS
jgi:hypothetical protein